VGGFGGYPPLCYIALHKAYGKMKGTFYLPSPMFTCFAELWSLNVPPSASPRFTIQHDTPPVCVLLLTGGVGRHPRHCSICSV
jgi:hypothetical protein